MLLILNIWKITHNNNNNFRSKNIQEQLHIAIIANESLPATTINAELYLTIFREESRNKSTISIKIIIKISQIDTKIQMVSIQYLIDRLYSPIKL